MIPAMKSTPSLPCSRKALGQEMLDNVKFARAAPESCVASFSVHVTAGFDGLPKLAICITPLHLPSANRLPCVAVHPRGRVHRYVRRARRTHGNRRVFASADAQMG